MRMLETAVKGWVGGLLIIDYNLQKFQSTLTTYKQKEHHSLVVPVTIMFHIKKPNPRQYVIIDGFLLLEILYNVS